MKDVTSCTNGTSWYWNAGTIINIIFYILTSIIFWLCNIVVNTAAAQSFLFNIFFISRSMNVWSWWLLVLDQHETLSTTNQSCNFCVIISMYMYMYMYVYVYVCICICMYMHVYACMCMYMYMYVYVYVYVLIPHQKSSRTLA